VLRKAWNRFIWWFAKRQAEVTGRSQIIKITRDPEGNVRLYYEGEVPAESEHSV